ncbi:MAG: homoserine dehydrogenase, partial [Candidatus Aminicenantes bacterium]
MEKKIGLIGCGTVGQGLLKILHDKRDFLRDTFGFEARIVAISDKIKGTLILPEGIDIPKVLAVLGAGKALADYPGATPAQVESRDPLDMIERTDADIIAELTYTDIKTG